jgi:outer membrane protein TolC
MRRPTFLAAGIVIVITCGAIHPARAQDENKSLGATLEGLLAVSRQLSPSLRAAALDTAAAAAKADGADALDDPMLNASYQYYRSPSVFSGVAVTVSQSFPLWGKRDLRRQAALADMAAARGREQSTRDESDERIKIAFAQYYAVSRQIGVDRNIAAVARRMSAAASARYGQGGGSQADIIQALSEETTAKVEIARLEGERSAIRARLNALIARPVDAPLAEPVSLPVRRIANPDLNLLLERARRQPDFVGGRCGNRRRARTANARRQSLVSRSHHRRGAADPDQPPAGRRCRDHRF